MADPHELAKIRKRRGVAKGLITRIETWLNEFEGESDCPDIQMLAKLKERDADFRKNHLTLIDLADDKEVLTSYFG